MAAAILYVNFNECAAAGLYRRRLDGIRRYAKARGVEVATLGRSDCAVEEVPEALDNTAAIAERCNVELKLKTGHYMLPSLELAEGMTLDSYLEEQARAGLKMRLKTEDPRRSIASDWSTSWASSPRWGSPRIS